MLTNAFTLGTMLYSELMHGYLQCSGDGLTEMVKGFPGETLYEDSDVYHFNLTKVTADQMATARQLREASKHIEAVKKALQFHPRNQRSAIQSEFSDGYFFN